MTNKFITLPVEDAGSIQGVPVDPTQPTNGQTLVYVDATNTWTPRAGGGGGGAVGAANTVQTTDGAGTLTAATNVLAGSGYVSIGTTPATTGSLRLSGTGTHTPQVSWFDGTANRTIVETDTVGNGLTFGNTAYPGAIAGSIVTLSSLGSTYLYANSAQVFKLSAAGGAELALPLAIGTTPATTGTIRLPSAGSIVARNAAGTADITIADLDSSNVINIGASAGSSVRINPAVFGYLMINGSTNMLISAGQMGLSVPMVGYNSPYALNGSATVTVADNATPTSTSAGGQNGSNTYKLAGALTANRSLTSNAATDATAYTKIVANGCTGAFSVIVGDGGAGTTVAVPNGQTKTVLFDSRGATDVTGVASDNVIAFVSGSTFAQLSGSLQKTATGLSYLVGGSNVTITSASNGQVTIAAAGGSTSPGGSTTQLQFNNAGAFGGIPGLVYANTALTSSIPVVVGQLQVTGSTANSIAANITATQASFGAATTLTAPSDVSFFVSGSKSINTGANRHVALFGGDCVFSGSIVSASINLSTITLTDTSAVADDMIVHNGTHYIRLATGVAGNQLGFGSTGLGWANAQKNLVLGTAQSSATTAGLTSSLSFTAGASETWDVEYLLYGAVNNTNGMYYKVVAPAGSTVSGELESVSASRAAANWTTQMLTGSVNSAAVHVGAGFGWLPSRINVRVKTAGTGGTVALCFGCITGTLLCYVGGNDNTVPGIGQGASSMRANLCVSV